MSELFQLLTRGTLRERLSLAAVAIGASLALHLVDKVAAGLTAAQAGLLP